MKRPVLIVIFLLVAIAAIAGFFVWKGRGTAQPETASAPPSAPTAPASPTDAFADASSTFGAASASSTPAEPVRWDVTDIAARKISFVPPKGYWVYFSTQELSYWLVEGDAPPAGSPDPVASALAHRVAIIHPVTWDHELFPTYDRFVTTMAQFDCAEGTSAENLVVCLDARSRVQQGKTVSGLPYEAFSLNAVLQSDQSPRGFRAFVVVRLGAENDHAIFLTPTDQRAADAVRSLAKTMRID